MTEPLQMWSIYHNAKDQPAGLYIARKWLIQPNKPVPTDDTRVGDTLDAVRDQLPRGLERLPRDSNDDPSVVETWV